MKEEYLLSKLVPKFIQYKEVIQSCSPRTIELYSYSLKKFRKWLQKDIQVQDITVDVVYNYRTFLNRSKTPKGTLLSAKSQREDIVALRSFLKYCHRHDIPAISLEKIDVPKAPQPVVTFLTPKEIQKLFKAIDTDTITGLRDRAIIETFYSTGLRISELVSLNRSQVDLESLEFTVIGKGRKPRIVFLSDAAKKAIKKYLDARDDFLDPLFLNHASNNLQRGIDCRMTKRSIAKMIHGIAQKAKITKKTTAHIIRHSFATDLLTNGADIRYVQVMLGHASIRTTQIYTHVTNPQLHNVHRRFHNRVKI